MEADWFQVFVDMEAMIDTVCRLGEGENKIQDGLSTQVEKG